MLCLQCQKEFQPTRNWQKFCQTKCKQTYNNPKYRAENIEYLKEYANKYKYTPRFKYNVQKHTSKRRGIEFLLSFKDWWELWKPYWEKRGKTKDSLVMCRIGDKGNYELGNVFISSYSQNSKEAALNFPREHSKETGRFI